MIEWLNLERLPGNDLPLPDYQTEHSAGIDFAACLTRQCKTSDRQLRPLDVNALVFNPNETIMVPLGFKCEFDPTYVLQLHVRSSIGLAGFQLANGTGIVDPDYRGELFACLYNRTNEHLIIKHGQRIVQGILLTAMRLIVQESCVSNTQRGENGFGSTGEKASTGGLVPE
jgi:dUTP pyrophosphatase